MSTHTQTHSLTHVHTQEHDLKIRVRADAVCFIQVISRDHTILLYNIYIYKEILSKIINIQRRKNTSW